jgi:hypothetical protein
MHRTAKAAGDPQRWRGALVVAVKKQGGAFIGWKKGTDLFSHSE